jgi:hypothetical protein
VLGGDIGDDASATEQRADGTGLFNLSGNVGSSVGISIVSYHRSPPVTGDTT